MSDEEDISLNAGDPQDGRREDGAPYVAGNTREDGSYRVGKGRPPESTRFRTGDGRKRGSRAKGTKNLLTDWREELSEKVTVVENGVRKRRTKQRAIVKKTAERAAKGSDRATEIAFRHARESEENAPGLRLADYEIIDSWLAQCGLAPTLLPSITDDLDGSTPDLEAGGAD